MFALVHLKTEIARSVTGPKKQGPHAEDAMAKPHLVPANFGDLTTADHKRQLRISKQSSICNRGARSSHPMGPGVSVQNKKLHKKPREACKSSWNPTRSPKSITLTIPWNSAKFVKISPGIIARPHHTDQKQVGLRKSNAESEGRHLCCIVAIGSR